MLNEECTLDDLVLIPTSYTSQDMDDYDPEAEMARFEQMLEKELNEIESDPIKPQFGEGPDVYIGFDSEFVSGKKGEDNTVLSLQFYLIGISGTLSKVVYPTGDFKSDRPSFYKTISNLIIEALEKKVILEWPKSVIICGFFLTIRSACFWRFSYVQNKIKQCWWKDSIN